jgi:hypothetical protein
VLDQLLHRRQADAQILQTALTEIAAHPRCRLPTREISERLDHYARLIGRRRQAACLLA